MTNLLILTGAFKSISNRTTNNAYKFMSGIEGMDRFGKVCAEIKPWVIDLECLAA